MEFKCMVAVTGIVIGVVSGSAQAAIVNVSGTFPDSPYSASIDLDVVNGQAVSGTGTFSGFGLKNVALVLITTDTYQNETNPGPVGFRANDGTDLGQFDQAFPVDTDGLLFDVGTTTASFGSYPLFGFGSNGNGTYYAIFDGKVDGIEHYVDIDSNSAVSLGTVPLPASAPMFGAALLALGAVGFGVKRKKAAAV